MKRLQVPQMTICSAHARRLRSVWLALLLLTLMTASVIEARVPAGWAAGIICLTLALKGRLIVDRLMGLRHARPVIRQLLLVYFYLLPLLIVWALWFPAHWVALTTL